MNKKIKRLIIGMWVIVFSIPLISYGVQITVPSAPVGGGNGYWLLSTTTGNYISTTTNPIMIGSLNATSTTATSTVTNALTVKKYLLVGQGAPDYPYVTNYGLDVGTPSSVTWNDFFSANVFNETPGTCATADFTANNDTAALLSNFADFGHTSSKFTGVGCPTGSYTGFPYNSTYTFDPNGSVVMGIASTSANTNFDWLTGGLDSGNLKMRLSNSGKLGLGTTTPGTVLSVVGDGYFTGRVTANNFVATSTTATSTLPNLAVTNITFTANPLIATTHLFIDGNRTDTYTSDGTINRPYKTIATAITGTPAGLPVIYDLAPATYVEGSLVTFPSVQVTFVGNGSTVVFVSGATIPSGYLFRNMTVSGNVTVTDTSTSNSHAFEATTISGNLIVRAAGATHTYNAGAMVNGTLNVATGTTFVAQGTFSQNIIYNSGALYWNGSKLVVASNSVAAINATTTFARIVGNGDEITNTGTGGGIACNNFATSSPHEIGFMDINVGVGTPTGSGLNCGSANASIVKVNLNDVAGKQYYPVSNTGAPALDNISNVVGSTTALYFVASSTSINSNLPLLTVPTTLTLSGIPTCNTTNALTTTGGVVACGAISGGGGGVTGTTGQNVYMSGTNTAVGTSTIFIDTTGNTGFGSTTPWGMVSIHHPATGLPIPIFVVASSTASATTTLFMVNNNGRIGIGSTTPFAKLSVNPIAGDGPTLFAIGSSTNLLLSFNDQGALAVTGAMTSASLTTTGAISSNSLGRVTGATHDCQSSTNCSFLNTNSSANTGVLITGSQGASGGFVVIRGSTNANAVADFVAIRSGKAAATEAFRVISNGNTGIGTTTPFAQLQVASTTGVGFRPQLALTDTGGAVDNKHVTISNISGNMYFGTATDALATSSTPNLTISNSGRMFMPGLTQSGANQTYYACGAATTFELIWDTTVCLVSARKFKTNENPIDVGLAEVLKLNPVTFNYKPTGNASYDNDPNIKSEQVGFIADDVQKIDPRLVTVDKKGDIHGFRYDQFTAVLTKAIQELNAKVESTKRSFEENYQWIAIGILALYVLRQQLQINKLKK